MRGSLSVLSIRSLVLAAVASTASAEGDPRAMPTHTVAPAKGHIPVAFVLTEGATMIDFAGPWEVFQDVMIPSRGPTMDDQMPFELFTVSDSKKPFRISGGLQVVPDFTFDDAPQPKIVVIPAQGGRSPKMLEWIRKKTTQSDVVMSVCTGAFKLGAAGVLKGKRATTHHDFFGPFQREFPDVLLQKGMRYVQSDSVVFTAGGLSSGIDLALHIVELYFGRTVASETARMMEYEGKGWMGDGSATASFAPPPAGPHPSDTLSGGVLGNWEGTLGADRGPVAVALHIWRDEHGALTGTVDSPEEGALDLPISAVRYEQRRLSFEVSSAGGRYDGTLDGEEAALSGTWSKGERALALTLRRAGR